jgi:hypothetical protein
MAPWRNIRLFLDDSVFARGLNDVLFGKGGDRCGSRVERSMGQ